MQEVILKLTNMGDYTKVAFHSPGYAIISDILSLGGDQVTGYVPGYSEVAQKFKISAPIEVYNFTAFVTGNIKNLYFDA